MKLTVLLVASALAAVTGIIFSGTDSSGSAANAGGTSRDAHRTPVVVELFTSEGCSSCPPADRNLIELEEKQPVAGAEVIALGQHVDYWDRLGWKDQFSSAEFTARQNRYAESFGNNGVYTPQMVVDGRAEFVGSDSGEARRAIAAASREPKAAVELSLAPGANGDAVRLQVRIAQLPVDAQEEAEVLLAITETKLLTDVRGGENSGRKLAHTAVVRRLLAIGRARPQQAEAFYAEPTVKLAKEWRRENLRAVLFVQDRTSRRIVAAAALSLSSN